MTRPRADSSEGVQSIEGAGARADHTDDEWVACRVELPNGIIFDAYVDRRMEDPLAQLFLSGQGGLVDGHLVELMLALGNPGLPVVDLGSFLGTFSLSAARVGLEVLAIDASPLNAELLTASAIYNRLPQIRVVNAAVAATSGVVTFDVNGPFGQVVTEPHHSDVSARLVRVNAARVDQLVEAIGWSDIGFLKMDVEGFEIEALKGMGTILDSRPPVIFESNGHTLWRYGRTPGDLFEVFAALGYSLFHVLGRRLIRIRPSDFQPLTVADYLAFDGVPDLAGWSLEGPLQAAELAELLAREAALGISDHRRYLAHALATAPAEVLAQAAIVETLESFQADAEDSIRQAASWWNPGAGSTELDAPQTTRPPGEGYGRGTAPRPVPTDLDRLIAQRVLFESSERTVGRLWLAHGRLSEELEAAVQHLQQAAAENEELRSSLLDRPHLGPRGTALAHHWLSAAKRYPRAVRLFRLAFRAVVSVRSAARRRGSKRSGG